MVQTYPAPQGISASPDFQVKVDGQPVFVYNPSVRINRDHPSSNMGVAIFDFTGSVTVTVTAQAGLERLVIRPKRLQIKPQIDGHTATFTLSQPCKITFEPDNVEKTNALAIFAGEPLQDEPLPGAPKLRYFGPGVHDAGVVQMQSGWTYWLAGGAYVRGHFQGAGLKNVKIRGRGVLDRLGSNLYKGGPASLQENPTIEFKDDRRHFIALEGCQDVLIEGITLLNGPGWALVPWACQDVVIRGIGLIADGANSDGIDICSCQRVLVEDVFVRNWDDCVVIKAKQMHGGGDCSDITVRHSVFWVDLAQGLEIGFECECAHIKHIVWSDIDIIHQHHNCAISIHNAGSAWVQDVLYEDIRIEDLDPERFRPERRSDLASNVMRLIDLWVGETPWWSDEGGRGRISQVRFKNISITTVGALIPPSRAAGFKAGHEVEDVVFEGLRINGALVASAAEMGLMVDEKTARGVQFVLPGQA